MDKCNVKNFLVLAILVAAVISGCIVLFAVGIGIAWLFMGWIIR